MKTTNQPALSAPKTPHNEVILDSIADGVFTVDRDWNVTSFNRAAEEITGVSRQQAIGQRCFDVFRADICQAACALRQTIEDGQRQIDRRITILDSRGQSVPVSISTAVLRDAKGRVIGGVETFRDLSAIEALRKKLRAQYSFADIVSKSHLIQRILEILPDVAASDSTVLIEGPSGSGKELFARAIHNLSPRRRRRYVAVNCGALPDTLLESELFGYRKGAFTDARKDKPGRFALADGGTLFLDEIGDISTALQVKLLRVLQEKEYEPLGATAPVKSNVRVIAATNKVLAELLARGVFREDLYYRLNVVRIVLPPLADRREDIPLLAEHFVAKFNALQGKAVTRVSEEALAALLRHDYPGNVRELENVIERAFVLCRGGEIGIEHLPPELQQPARLQGPAVTANAAAQSLAAADPLRQAEAEAISRVLRKHGGRRDKAAAELGIHPATLWRKLKRLGID